jgi:hypothetical protein
MFPSFALSDTLNFCARAGGFANYLEISPVHDTRSPLIKRAEYLFHFVGCVVADLADRKFIPSK